MNFKSGIKAGAGLSAGTAAVFAAFHQIPEHIEKTGTLLDNVIVQKGLLVCLMSGAAGMTTVQMATIATLGAYGISGFCNKETSKEKFQNASKVAAGAILGGGMVMASGLAIAAVGSMALIPEEANTIPIISSSYMAPGSNSEKQKRVSIERDKLGRVSEAVINLPRPA